MKQAVLIGVVLLIGLVFGLSISSLDAQAQSDEPRQGDCYVGEGSNAACVGKWVVFAGNSGNLDESAWVLRIDSETGEIWFKNGRRLQQLEEAQ